MSARNELLGYLATSIGTVVVLFVLQVGYASYLDVHVVHGALATPPNEALEQARAADAQKLAGGKLSLEAAKAQLAARGRSPALTPQQSDDLSAMSGWIRSKGFAPYTPREPAASQQGGAEVVAGEGELPPAEGLSEAEQATPQTGADEAPDAPVQDTASEAQDAQGASADAAGQEPAGVEQDVAVEPAPTSRGAAKKVLVAPGGAKARVPVEQPKERSPTP
jgi:hypothetical protein